MKNLKRKLLSKTTGKSSYWTLNKKLVRSIGLESTLILQHIIDLQEVFEKDEVFQPQPKMSDELGITLHSIKIGLSQLIKMELIRVVKKGVPCKNYYSTNDDKIIQLIINDDDDYTPTPPPTSERNFHSVENQPISEVNINSPVGGNSTDWSDEIPPTITKNTTKEPQPNNTDKEYSKLITVTEVRMKWDKLLRGVLQTDDIKLFNDSLSDIKEIGFDKIAEDNNWDNDVYNNWVNRINQNISIISDLEK